MLEAILAFQTINTVLLIWIWMRQEKLYFELTDFTQDNHNPED